MDIISALKSEATKLQHQLDTLNSAMKILGGTNSVSRGNARRKKRHFAFLRCFKGEKGSESKGEVGENKSSEE